jgi:hypothetical protein
MRLIGNYLLGMGWSTGFSPYPFGYIGRVLNRCDRKRGSYFVPRKLIYNTTQLDFAASDSA